MKPKKAKLGFMKLDMSLDLSKKSTKKAIFSVKNLDFGLDFA